MTIILVKPFSPKEVVARIKAILRRTGRKASSRMVVGPLVVDPEARKVLVGEQESLT